MKKKPSGGSSRKLKAAPPPGAVTAGTESSGGAPVRPTVGKKSATPAKSSKPAPAPPVAGKRAPQAAPAPEPPAAAAKPQPGAARASAPEPAGKAKKPATVAAKAASPEKASPAKSSSPVARTETAPAPPPILLEGDATRPVSAGGPGDRYVLGPGIRGTAPASGEGDLPVAYGTGKLLLVARDPHWVYAHWDLTDEQIQDYNRRSKDGHLALRIYSGVVEGEPLLTQDVHPESRNWFVHVPRAGARYVAELGYFGKDGVWNRVSTSSPTATPAEDLSDETWVRFETLPMEVSMATLVEVVKRAVSDSVPLVEAIAQLRSQGFTQLPLPSPGETPQWSPEQERALASVISMDEVRRLWIGSLEITELVRRHLARGISSGEVPISSLGMVGEISSVSSLSSPMGAAPGARGFWFNVNAELIIYGATDPKATVRIGERTIQLRPDGTFSYRFALPDGEYSLPIQATSPDAVETRSAALSFSRASEYRGDVGAHPQDQALRPPRVEHVA